LESNGEGWTLANSASISLSKSDVALLSPSCSPTVLNGPGSFRRTHEENSMVDVFVTVVENTAFVGTPARSVNSHSNRASHQNLLNFVATCNFGNSKDTERSTICLALLVDSNVRIICTCSLSMILDPLERSNSIATIAALVEVRCTS